MEISVRKSRERGHADHGWLDSCHTFSFADYYDPKFMGFGPLRVINEDRVAAGGGFPAHGHRDMEIISYVLEGALAHQDSLGTGSVIRPGDVQRMTAGTGVRHSEMNASKTEPVHFLQIWIMPDRAGHLPSYEQRSFSREERAGKLRVVASPDGRDGSVSLHQDAIMSAGLLAPDDRVTHAIALGRTAWLQVASGAIDVNGQRLVAGDGLSASGPGELAISATEPTELIAFDLG